MPNPQTLKDIIDQSRRSIDDAHPSEWNMAATKNYGEQTPDYFSTTLNFDSDSKDEINSPEHYNFGKYETIDVIVDTLGEYEAINYCHGNVLKYVIRMWHKGKPEADARKAVWYLNKMIELLENTKGKNW
jgi:hypothetical protein